MIKSWRSRVEITRFTKVAESPVREDWRATVRPAERAKRVAEDGKIIRELEKRAAV